MPDLLYLKDVPSAIRVYCFLTISVVYLWKLYCSRFCTRDVDNTTIYTMDHQISQSISSQPEKPPGVAQVAFPIAVPGVYDYAIPSQYLGCVACGMPVLVPLRNRETWGVVVGLSSSSQFSSLKEIVLVKLDQLDSSGAALQKLYEWIAAYYQCDIGRVFKPFLRKGVVGARAKTVTEYIPDAAADPAILNDKYRKIFSEVQQIAPCTAKEASLQKKVTRASLEYLSKQGFLNTAVRTVLREAFELRMAATAHSSELTVEQQEAVARIMEDAPAPKRPFLLFGITGSGKTHVYIALASQMLREGKGVIILVPEIALTPQTIQRFKGALGDVLTVIHSNMSDGERRDSLEELVTGKKKVVIGVRSAILAPVQNVGCIIVDEEHDGSYKQSDMEPRYHARDVAVMRGKLQGALVVLGSATPAMESYHNALTGKYTLIRLLSRFGAATLPLVEVVDMRLEKEENNWKPLSRRLHTGIVEALAQGRQIILLLNRRGFSTVLMCQDCGYTAACPDCSVTLRYHRADTSLKCHICGFFQPAPHCCPSCRGEKIKYKGTGIQKIEEALHEEFPLVRVLRMDQDSTRTKGAHARILEDFAQKKADILLGTQMVAKGLNFPGVALVGVIAADTGLHIPDFRASERTFQLLTQVAGRAGRSDSLGQVIIQTYSPEESAIINAAQHDYETFYQSEQESRKALNYPPYSRLVRVVVEGAEESLVISTIDRIASQIRHLGKNTLLLLGPVPAVVERIKGEVRHILLIKSHDRDACSRVIFQLRSMNKKIPASLRIIFDIDPVNML